MEGLTLDTGALLALERQRKGMTKVAEAARQGRVPMTVPSNAVAEWWRGRSDRRDHVRKMFVIKDVDKSIAKLAARRAVSSCRDWSSVMRRATIFEPAPWTAPTLVARARGERLDRLGMSRPWLLRALVSPAPASP